MGTRGGHGNRVSEEFTQKSIEAEDSQQTACIQGPRTSGEGEQVRGRDKGCVNLWGALDREGGSHIGYRYACCVSLFSLDALAPVSILRSVYVLYVQPCVISLGLDRPVYRGGGWGGEPPPHEEAA